MARYRQVVGGASYAFEDLKSVLACASPVRSGDELAGVAADGHEHRIAARLALADLPLRDFLSEVRFFFDAPNEDAVAERTKVHWVCLRFSVVSTFAPEPRAY
jgi:ethanolamine ammonia-lyase large subunit